MVTTATAATEAGLSLDKTVKCHCVLVPVISPQELKIDQLRESAVINPHLPFEEDAVGEGGGQWGSTAGVQG